ncbi:hypothetical protein MSAN_01378700 [Mycena sanguinolenta]|uniref:3-carboxymuconate cyclase n=1 Tax=Mycena sanguinolenta TaxID=230812 RepID=A0A8H6YA57_9AGAR|nr:hypothetical protein MSAN_01378700 [Mycena sanguinolenta]
MQTALLLLLSALSSTVMASSEPTARMSMAPTGFNFDVAVGAAYFMTNEPTGNYLVSSAIGLDGKLTLYEAVYTGGVGSHGLPPPFGLDALFSQGSVGVSTKKRFVANVNAGSNSVSVFAIDPLNPAQLWPIGKPVSSGGEFPNSLVINNAGTRVCVLNAGKVNGVSCYKFDHTGLTPIKNSIRSLGLNQTTPATGPPNTPSQIIFSQDETQLIVSVKAGYLAVWDINSDGSLSTTYNTVSGGVLPLLAQPHSREERPGCLGPWPVGGVSVPIPNQGASCWSVYSAESGNFYIIDVGISVITEVAVTNSLNSSIVKQYNVVPDGPIDSSVATLGKKDFIYSLAANVTGLSVYSVNGPGEATVYQRLDVAGPAKAAGLPINRTNVQGMATFIGF